MYTQKICNHLRSQSRNISERPQTCQTTKKVRSLLAGVFLCCENYEDHPLFFRSWCLFIIGENALVFFYIKKVAWNVHLKTIELSVTYDVFPAT